MKSQQQLISEAIAMYLSIASIRSCKAAMPSHSLRHTCKGANPALPSPSLRADFLFLCPVYRLLQKFDIAWFHCQLEFLVSWNDLWRAARTSCSLLLECDMQTVVSQGTNGIVCERGFVTSWKKNKENKPKPCTSWNSRNRHAKKRNKREGQLKNAKQETAPYITMAS